MLLLPLLSMMQAPEHHLLGLVEEYAMRLRVARSKNDFQVLTAIWQTPGPLALQLMLYLTAQSAITVYPAVSFSASSPSAMARFMLKCRLWLEWCSYGRSGRAWP